MSMVARLHRLIVMWVAVAAVAAVGLLAALAYPAAVKSELRTLPLEILAVRAREEARRIGLELDSTAQTAIPMTLRDWLSLRNVELDKDADRFGLSEETPVLVVAMRGNPARTTSPAYADSDLAWPAHDNVTMVLDARNGDLLWVGVASPGFTVTTAWP